MLFRVIQSTIIIACLLCSSGFTHAAMNIEVHALLGKKVVLQINGVRRTLSLGQISPEGVELISANNSGARLKVEGSVKEYRLGASVSTRYAEPENLEEKVFADEMGMFLRNGSINGKAVEFLIDTGASSIAMNTIQAKNLGIRYLVDGKESIVDTASGIVNAYAVTLDSVSLGGIKQRNVPAMVIDGEHPGPILLGMTFLSNLKVSTRGKVMTLQRRK